mmetsp:Transcript_33508/g.57858  ORF Transcript_33508/g.57858 Transcript_33508/m.57858 type:complete len:148 (+) Transcript_33508:96-539(+)
MNNISSCCHHHHECGCSRLVVWLLLRFSMLQLMDELLQQVSVLLQSLLHTQRIDLCWWSLHNIVWLVYLSWFLLVFFSIHFFWLLGGLFGCGGTANFCKRAFAVAAACFYCLSELRSWPQSTQSWTLPQFWQRRYNKFVDSCTSSKK